MAKNPWAITTEQADTLPAVFRERVAASGVATAYTQFDTVTETWRDYSWRHVAVEVSRWQAALRAESLAAGDRVAIMCSNSMEWVTIDQAALGMGLVVVPVYTNDRAENVSWILHDAGVSLLVLESVDHWAALRPFVGGSDLLKRVLLLSGASSDAVTANVDDWLTHSPTELAGDDPDPDALATIVYTSGTTGKPKGVMLSHRNIVWNIHACLERFEVRPDDVMLSFLPLSHMLERTVGYYLAMVAGTSIAFNRGIPLLADDLVSVKPTLMISVPRIFERVYAKITDQLAQESPLKRKLFNAAVDAGWERHLRARGQAGWSLKLLLQPLLDRLVGAKVRAKLGGRLRFTVCGGAALAPDIARFFIGLGIPVTHGYGLTETSPVIAANILEDNVPETVGPALHGIEVRVDDRGELLTRSPSNMLGYWKNPEATRDVIESDGWLHTGDKVIFDEAGRIQITGRIKDIIVLTNGEKVPPADLENAIALDSMVDQVILIGEGKPYLVALVVPNAEQFEALANGLHLDPANQDAGNDENIRRLMLERVQQRLAAFPGYAKVRSIAVIREPWTTENGFMTPTMKLRRAKILESYRQVTEALYTNH